ncbi:Abhydrolase-3 domain-containing protein [Fusarium sp. Ph1]|nr:Abhydrolase-3 domain-containing protein [Fusarium sp. Ph1]
MDAPSLPSFEGYSSKTFIYKSVDGLDLKLDALIPLDAPDQVPVVVHIHGGFLVIGDRYSIQPYWLIKACVRRRWIFVSPDYRLIPEATGHDALEDAVHAYEWVAARLAAQLGIRTGGVILAGSSAGGFLALAAATRATTRPLALISIYGMLDLAHERYTCKGTNIMGLPPVNGGPILDQFLAGHRAGAAVLSGYPWPLDLAKDSRFGLVAALHVEEAIAAQGPKEAIPVEARPLFPATFGPLGSLPPTLLLHGRNDTGTPFETSLSVMAKLADAGVWVTAEFPGDAPHGFDVLLGPVDLESQPSTVPDSEAVLGLKKVIGFLDLITGTKE